MPIYCYRCECGETEERLSQMNEAAPVCTCGRSMGRVMTYPALVKIQGDGGYPSRRKFAKGTAPFTTRSTKPWLSEDPHAEVNYMGTSGVEANIEKRRVMAPAPELGG